MATNSIVDYLKSQGKASDFNTRAGMASEYGISNYTGTADQNTQLLGKLQNVVTPDKIGTSTPTPPVIPPRPTGSVAVDNTVKYPETPAPTPAPAPTLREQVESKLTSMATTPQPTREEIKTEVGFGEKQKRVQTLENYMMRLQEVRDRQLEQLEKNPEGMFGGALEANINKKLKENAKEMAKLNVEYRLAQDDFAGAQQAVKDRLQDIQDQKTYDLQVFQAMQTYLQNDLTDSEKLQMSHNLQMNQLDYEAQLQKEQAEYAYRLETGDFTGTIPGAGQVSTSTGAYDVSTYATDPTYAEKLQIIHDKYASQISSPEQADAVIKSSAPNSKLTGDMIYRVANANGIDPIFLMAQLKQESNFGTLGAATKNTNFGGVKYVGQANAKQGTLSPEGDYYANFNTVEDALNTQAQEVAKRKVTGGVDLNGIVNTILASGKFTKDQTRAIRNGIKNGEDPLTVIKNQAKGLMSSPVATEVEGMETALDVMNALESNLKAYYAQGGDTNIFKGNYEKVVNKVGAVSDPRLVSIAVQIQANLQAYRKAVSGTAYSIQEGAEIASIFPGINKTEGLNRAIIDGRKTFMSDFVDARYKNAIGPVYETLKEQYRPDTQTSEQPVTPQVQVAPEKEDVFNQITGSDSGQRGGFFMNRKRPEGEGGGVVWDFLKALGLRK